MTVHVRDAPLPEDARAIGEVVASTGFFNAAEEAVAVELVKEALARGDASGYRFLVAVESPAGAMGREMSDGRPQCRRARGVSAVNVESEPRVVGYACYGPIAGTRSSFELYWIVVHAEHRGAGLGRLLMRETLDKVRGAGGTRLYADTSSRKQYEPTRRFYRAMGFREEAFMADFYSPGDGKLVYLLEIAPSEPAGGHVTR